MIGQYLLNTNERAFYKIGLGLFYENEDPTVVYSPSLCSVSALPSGGKPAQEKRNPQAAPRRPSPVAAVKFVGGRGRRGDWPPAGPAAGHARPGGIPSDFHRRAEGF